MKISDLQESFIKRIERMVSGFDEGRGVFDRYLDSSLKNKTRQKRSTTSVEFKIHPEMRLTMSIKDLLSSSKSKSMLVTLFANGLLARFFSNTAIKLVVVYDNKIRYLDCEEEHTHEEADTLIPNQVLRSIDEHLVQEICVSSPDTDVLVLLLDLVSRGRHGNLNGLKFLTGKGTNYRRIDVIQRVQAIGIRKCQGLIGLHHFTGADWGGKFVGITKKTWVKAYMALNDDHPAIDCFRELGEGLIQNQLANGELPSQVKELEKFVCQVYCKAGPTTLPELRWELFRSRNLEGEMLPPTRASLLPHITRANFMAMRTNPIPPAAQIFLPSKRMAGVNTKEHTFLLCASLFLRPKLLSSLPNVAASQTARDAVAVSRTEFHAPRFANALEKTVQIHSQTTHQLMTRRKMMMLLVYKNFSHILWTNIYTLT